MVVVPLEQGIAHNGWKTLRLIAADMDGTLGSPALQQNKGVSRLESLRVEQTLCQTLKTQLCTARNWKTAVRRS